VGEDDDSWLDTQVRSEWLQETGVSAGQVRSGHPEHVSAEGSC
jgi:hypothetical protein